MAGAGRAGAGMAVTGAGRIAAVLVLAVLVAVLTVVVQVAETLQTMAGTWTVIGGMIRVAEMEIEVDRSAAS